MPSIWRVTPRPNLQFLAGLILLLTITIGAHSVHLVADPYWRPPDFDLEALWVTVYIRSTQMYAFHKIVIKRVVSFQMCVLCNIHYACYDES